jgi:hypothetical protein
VRSSCRGRTRSDRSSRRMIRRPCDRPNLQQHVGDQPVQSRRETTTRSRTPRFVAVWFALHISACAWRSRPSASVHARSTPSRLRTGLQRAPCLLLLDTGHHVTQSDALTCVKERGVAVESTYYNSGRLGLGSAARRKYQAMRWVDKHRTIHLVGRSNKAPCRRRTRIRIAS